MVGSRADRLGEKAAKQLMAAPDMWTAFNDIQGDTHTGNHYRNHYVKVPTAPGEPCRG